MATNPSPDYLLRLRIGSILVAALLSGCAGQTYSPESAPEFAVLPERAEFFRFGPLQASPPDELISQDTIVRVVRREFGYSLVQLEGERTGYMANDDLIPAPEREVRVATIPEPAPEIVLARSDPSPTRRSRGPLPPPVDDEPLPDFGAPLSDSPALTEAPLADISDL